MQSTVGLNRPPGIEPVQARFHAIAEDLTTNLPEELVLAIFAYLDLPALVSVSQVNKLWRQLSGDRFLWKAVLKSICPRLQIFDDVDLAAHIDLAAYGLSVDGASPLRLMIPHLRRCPSLPVEGEAGITLLTIPKGLTLNKLIKLARSPQQGKSTRFGYNWDRILYEIGDIEVAKTYHIVITNNIFEGSRGKTVAEQRDLVGHHGCEMPRTLEQAFLLAITHIMKGKRLYTDDPWTYSCCEEQILESHVLVGGFGSTCYIGINAVLRKYNSCSRDVRGMGGVLRGS